MYFMFVFSPKWDMRWLRAKEIKDSPNSQAVPKILVHKKITLPGSTLYRVAELPSLRLRWHYMLLLLLHLWSNCIWGLFDNNNVVGFTLQNIWFPQVIVLYTMLWRLSHCWSCTTILETSMAENASFTMLTLKVLNFWKFTSYCSLKPLWSGMGKVVPARTSPTLHPPSPPTVHQLSWLAL